MALKLHVCECGREFDALTQYTVVCPSCGSLTPVETFTPCAVAFDCGKNVHLLPKGEVQMALGNKAKIQGMADKVRSGEVELRPGKNEPSEFRPKFEKVFH